MRSVELKPVTVYSYDDLSEDAKSFAVRELREWWRIFYEEDGPKTNEDAERMLRNEFGFCENGVRILNRNGKLTVSGSGYTDTLAILAEE